MGGTLSRLRRRAGDDGDQADQPPATPQVAPHAAAGGNTTRRSPQGLNEFPLSRQRPDYDQHDPNWDGEVEDVGGTGSDSESNESLHPRKPYASAPTLLF